MNEPSLQMKEYLISLAAYNVWANERIQLFVEEAGESAGALVQKSSFVTLRETIIHIWDAQHIWIDRLNGNPVVDWPGKSFSGNTNDAAIGLLNNSKQWEEFVNNLPLDSLDNRVTYTNTLGQEFSNKVMHIIVHVMNHGTFHRGQLVTMLRGTGYTGLKSTDLITFYRDFQY